MDKKSTRTERKTPYGLQILTPSTHYRSCQRRDFTVNHLHWYWQPNKNNQEIEHTKSQNNTTQKGALVNSTTHTFKKSRLRELTDGAWFSCLVRHPARKRSRSILTTPEPARGMYIFLVQKVTCTQGWALFRNSWAAYPDASQWLILDPASL